MAQLFYNKAPHKPKQGDFLTLISVRNPQLTRLLPTLQQDTGIYSAHQSQSPLGDRCPHIQAKSTNYKTHALETKKLM